MSHTHDVIKINSKEFDQKIKSEDFLQVIQNFWILSPELWNLSHKECFICIDIFHHPSERQEIDHKSKLLVWRFIGSSKEKVSNFDLKLFSILEEMFHLYFYFVYHISSHVIEASGKSSYSFLELFLWIISLCHVWYLKLKPRRHWSQKYSFLDILIIRPEVGINLPIKWSNWLFLSS